MKHTVTRRVGICFAVLSFAAVGTVIAACEDDPTPSVTSPDGSTGIDVVTTPPSTAGDGGAGGDSGDSTFEDDGGGVVIDDDGGILVDEDGGFDGGVACPALTPGDFIDTSCNNRIKAWAGGDLVTATYELTAIQVLVTSTKCTDAGAAAEHRGALKVTASSTSAATLEFFDQGRTTAGQVRKLTTRRYDVAATALTNTLTLTAADCRLTKPPPTASYSVGKNGSGKRTFSIRLPYTSPGSLLATYAVYHYVEP